MSLEHISLEVISLMFSSVILKEKRLLSNYIFWIWDLSCFESFIQGQIILRKGKGFLERITALDNMYSYRKVKKEKKELKKDQREIKIRKSVRIRDFSSFYSNAEWRKETGN